MTIEIVLDEATVELTGEGIWTTDAFQCTLTTSLGGLALAQSVIATPETLWLDSGTGYQPAALFDGGVQGVISSCPSYPLFWNDFTSTGLGRPIGEEVDIDGRTAIKADLTEALDVIGGFGLVDGLESATINRMVMWVDTETNVVLGLSADMELDAEFAAEFGATAGDTGPVSMLMKLRVERINDPTLSIDVPTGS
jgi:hypothetical protein